MSGLGSASLSNATGSGSSRSWCFSRSRESGPLCYLPPSLIVSLCVTESEKRLIHRLPAHMRALSAILLCYFLIPRTPTITFDSPKVPSPAFFANANANDSAPYISSADPTAFSFQASIAFASTLAACLAFFFWAHRTQSADQEEPFLFPKKQSMLRRRTSPSIITRSTSPSACKRRAGSSLSSRTAAARSACPLGA